MPLQSAIDKTEEINKYDYDRMIKEFRSEESLQKMHREEKKMWEKKSEEYLKRVDEMKDYRADQYKKKKNALTKLLREKEQKLAARQKNQKESKMAEKQKRIEEMAKKEQAAIEKVEKYQVDLEKKRLILEKNTEEKSNNFHLI